MAKRRLMGDINVVPYIDVMLVLLVIFMVATPLLLQGVDVSLPDTNTAPLPVETNASPMVVTLDKAGQLFLSIAGEDAEAMTALQLRRAVANALTERPNVDVFLRADQAIAYGAVMDAMALLQQAGAESVGFVTESKGP